MSVADSVLDLAASLGGVRVTQSAFFVGAKAIIGDGGLSRAWAAAEARDWSGLVDVGIAEAAEVIAAVDPALARIAPLLATAIIWARHHPAGTVTAAMMAADGHGGAGPGTDHLSLG